MQYKTPSNPCRLAVLSACLLLLSVPSYGDVVYENNYYKLTLDGGTGAIKAIEKDGRNMIDEANIDRALFEICFRDQANKGKVVRAYSSQAQKCEINQIENKITLSYSDFAKIDLSAIVTVDVSKDSPFMKWNIRVDNRSSSLMDYIDFPNVVVPDDLVSSGGDARIFWPSQEGAVIEDVNLREGGNRKYKPIEYPNLLGWIGIYPSSTQMQFMAYYAPEGGLYMATHDDQFHVKGIEFHKEGEKGIKFDYHLFTTGAGKGEYTLPYDVVLGTFDGDWYDAADIYRDWVESSDMPRPPKITDNKELPDWYFESPVVVTYPVRGHVDLGDMTPNELYPYTNALGILDGLGQAFDSKVMALLMHWEGSAPWAPPYVWPPYGDVDNYQEFVDGLHEQGNYIGLYASGTGYTVQSNTDPTYNMEDEFERLNLETVMKKAPDGGYSTRNVCAAPHAQRLGYDMCPTNQFVKDVVIDQVTKMVKEGRVDYTQYFDQNLGGNCYGCYSTEHGHGYGPGAWQSEAMSELYQALMPVLAASDRKPLLGCEAAAAEPFIPYLLFNDNRAGVNLGFGTPVPAYQFVYHEYLNGFMGNQNSIRKSIDLEQSPLNMLQRLALAFASGDMFTVILRGNGEMIEAWGMDWEAPIPNQEHMKTLIKNLNAWRVEAGKNFLVTGRMMKPLAFEGATNIPMISKHEGRPVNFPSIFTSNWQSQDGGRAQFFVNYLPEAQEIMVSAAGLKDVVVSKDASDSDGSVASDKLMKIAIEPLSAVMVRYSE